MIYIFAYRDRYFVYPAHSQHHRIDTAICRGKLNFPFQGVTSLTMIAVGVGVAPMVQTLRGIFKVIDRSRADSGSVERNSSGTGCVSGDQSVTEDVCATATECSIKRIVLLYGVVRYT